jgi:hypothetical protein
LRCARCRLQVAGYRLQVAGYRLQVAGCRLQVAGCRLGSNLEPATDACLSNDMEVPVT